MSCAGVEGKDELTRCIAALCRLISKKWFQGRSIEACFMSSVRVRSAKVARRPAAGREVVRDSAENGSSLGSALEGSALAVRTAAENKSGRRG